MDLAEKWAVLYKFKVHLADVNMLIVPLHDVFNHHSYPMLLTIEVNMLALTETNTLMPLNP